MKKNIIIVFLIVFTTLISCKQTTNNENASTKKEATKTTELILTENSLGNFILSKETILSEEKLKESFPDKEITKKIGQQDGPNFYCFSIGSNIILKTTDTSNEKLYQVWIEKDAKVKDTYGISIGTSFIDLNTKRTDLKYTTEHFKTYVYQEGSHICYQIQMLNYNGPDKEEYSLEEVKNSKVIAIIWK